MLTLTNRASTVIRSLVGSELPDGGGLRIASTNNGQQAFTVEAATNPQAGDHVVEDDGARVFLENQAAGLLGDSVLDADIDDTGNVEFILTGEVGEA